VLDSCAHEAFAVPGRLGRIVVSVALLRGLDGDQRRALLAHERAHLDHHHHIHQTAAHLVAAINPLLRPLAAAVELSCERWADEVATRVCHRSTVADALTRAATGQSGRVPEVTLAAGATEVVLRVGALRVPARPIRTWPVTLLTLLMVTTAIAVAIAMRDTERLFELAQHTYRAGRR
jgi:beta-lactamase regulating signal transducer with metallopeptidase domain